ncbi:MAG: hypothetical protein Q9214_000638, partial [Letrouitia sp. 1 TL-2023]
MLGGDGSEDVSDFLKRIRELGDQRDREDEERNRKLEEEIIQGRKERQARRAERARSISPTKDQSSNVGTPSSIRSTTESLLQDDSMASPLTLRSPSTPRDNPNGESVKPSHRESTRALPQPSVHQPELSDTSPTSSTTLSRGGTLSWQQRPLSRGSAGPRARPLSVVATENYAARSPRASVEPPTESEKEMSRDEIAARLGSKDPTWFRQTQDRGVGSAAYRRNQDDAMSDTSSLGGSIRLAGMSRTSVTDHEKDLSPAPESELSQSLSRESSIRDCSERGTNHPNPSSLSSASGIRSPLPIMESQIFEPPSTSGLVQSSDVPTSRAMAMSPSQGRLSPERVDRASSPTKGLGGFVQSAMLKRSDSVTKRWSAQPGMSLSRSNSIASNRSGYDSSRKVRSNMSPPREQRGDSFSRNDMSRPGSNQNMATVTQKKSDSESNYLGNNPRPTSEDRASTPPSQHRSQTTNFDNWDDSAERSPPLSPSKKWSPTKSSWLENAINKPESPKPKVASFHQPPWIVNINQTKQQRGGHDASKNSGFKEITPGGLLRSPPMNAGVKPPNIAGVPAHFGASSGQVPESTPKIAPKTLDRPTSPKYATPDPKRGVIKAQSPTAEPENPLELNVTSADFQPPKPEVSPLINNGDASPPASSAPSESPILPKPKPETPPKKDFRANLKSRRMSSGKKEAEDLEFKSVFGKLKRTQTQNYVAPDELKDNILRGKAGLTVTGGPKKSERKDEFKESILKKKEAMKAGTSTARVQKTSRDMATPDNNSPLPEALAKQRGLTQSD